MLRNLRTRSADPRHSSVLNEVLSITAQESTQLILVKKRLEILNEVLSITAQESIQLDDFHRKSGILNEVLSITAQELPLRP